MNKLQLLIGIALASFAIELTQGGETAEASRPNILLIVTDDQGYWDTGATGNPHIDTPHMDSIANDGMQFKRFYTAPVCAPTRAGLMTGRYYLRTGLYNTRFGGDTLGKDEITVAQLLKSNGYRTGLFGKWHLGKYFGYQPNQRGFDEFMGHYHGHLERYEFPNQIVHNGKPVEARGYVTDLFTDAAIDFVESTTKTSDDPFFCYLAYNAPHSPFLLDTSHFGQPEGDKLLTKYLGKKMPIREARIYALIERVDQNIGRLLNSLKTLGIERDTLVLFMSDNGGVSKFWKGGMRGYKASPYEGGVRSPLFVRWPGVVKPGGEIETQTSHVDLLPTFCELAGVELPTDRKIDGKSLFHLMKAGANENHHEYVYHTWDRYFPNAHKRWSVSDQRWKLVGSFAGNAKPDPAKWQLFDLQADPNEKRNLRTQQPENVARLRKAFVDWFDDVTDGVEYRPIAIPVGHAEENPVLIQPSWATWTGKNVNYTFDGYDWDTIDGWKLKDEKAAWRLDVVQGGRYSVSLTYGCRPLDAGGKLRIQVGKSNIEHTVKPTATKEQFERFTIGEIDLTPGANSLVAEVVSAPGRELMRLNKIELEFVSPSK